jgi:hypothetical protein
VRVCVPQMANGGCGYVDGASNVTFTWGNEAKCVSSKFKPRSTGLSTDSIPVDRSVTGLCSVETLG